MIENMDCSSCPDIGENADDVKPSVHSTDEKNEESKGEPPK
jgi:hypothetical protein